MMNKRGVIELGKKVIWVVIALGLLSLIFLSSSASAAKADQYYAENKTCEKFTDAVFWSALAGKGTNTILYFNWSLENDAPGQKNKDIAKIETYTRYADLHADANLIIPGGHAMVANTTQSNANASLATYTRYAAYLNYSLAGGTVSDTRWECGFGAPITTCDTTNQGYNNYTKIYSVMLFARSEGNNNAYLLTDVFNIRYAWCWTPIIENITVSPDSATYATTFNFTVNVTNPTANTTVYFWIRPVGGTWTQNGSAKYCANCSSVQAPNNGKLFWEVNFGSGQEGNWEFKFNATDNAGYSVDANSSSTTNECLDIGNDCKFTVETVAAAEGSPVLVNWTVNGVQSGATEGWGSNWTFSTNVSNPADGVGNINLTLLLDTGEGFVNKGSQICNSPCSNSKKFTFYIDDLACSDMSSAQYKFNATNTNGSSFATQSFTIEADDLNIIYVQGNNSIANRSANQTDLLVVRINDTDNRTIVSSGVNTTFYVKFNSVSYDSGNLNITNSSGYASHYFNATCTPTKHLIGDRDWQANASGNACYKNTGSPVLNLSVKGDIKLEFTSPSSSSNFSQEDTINFLGATTDDCDDALTATVKYNANLSSGSGFACTNTIQVGANAFTCNYLTSLTSAEGWYNTTIFANFSNHYSNNTQKTGIPGLFYMLPKKKLQNPQGNSTTGAVSDGWGSPNWNFSVLASSGDAYNVINVSLYLGKSVNPTTTCETTGNCANQTQTNCTTCNSYTMYWNKNFTDSNPATNTIGQWFYQFKMDDIDETFTSGTTKYITVTKDENNISYGGQGEGEEVVINSTPQTLAVRVFDKDKNSYNVTLPSANVTFKLWDAGYGGDNKRIIGYNTTNESGYATLFFNATVCSYAAGSQVWIGEIDSSEPNYQQNISANNTLIITLTGCTANVAVDQVLTPKGIFQYRNFTINSTINSYGGASSNVNVTLNVPDGWIVGPNRTQSLGSIAQTTPTTVSWIVNATTYGTHNATVFANSSTTNATGDTTVDFFQVYKEGSEGTADVPAYPKSLGVGENYTTAWLCNIGDYRIATLNLTGNTTASGALLRVETYNGTEFIDVLHSYYFNANGAVQSFYVPLLENQIDANETGYCTIKIYNLKGGSYNLTSVKLEAYYNETISVRDITAEVGGVNTSGIELNQGFVNFSVILSNSNSTAYLLGINLTITNSSGYILNSTLRSGVLLVGGSTINTRFLNVNTTNWTAGNYILNAYVTSNVSFVNNRTETLIFRNISVYSTTADYMCNSTTEQFNVTVYHPFTDRIEYNVSLQMPAGWVYSGYQLRNISTIGNSTFVFNINSSTSAAENITINATANYTYLGIKQKNVSRSIEESNSIPILEIIRETPTVIGGNKVFESQLTVHNKGCAATSSATVQETLSTGWTPANPSIKTNSYGADVELVSTSTDLETNVITWNLGTVGIDKYAVLTYQIKSPTSTSTAGALVYNASWSVGRNLTESPSFNVQTLNYTSESHLEFRLEAIQNATHPQPEVRSIQPNVTYNYTLTTTNIGDINATGWNVTLDIPSVCNVTNVYQGGVYNSTLKRINWELPETVSRSSQNFNFTLNCTTTGSYILKAQGIKDNRTISSFSNATSDIGCTFTSGNSCSDITSFNFTKPGNARYEKLNNVNFTIYYNWYDYRMTIGEGSINITDDTGKGKIIWQNFSLNSAGTSGTLFANYTLDSGEQNSFVEAVRNIGVKVYVDSTSAPKGNVTVNKLDYTWNTGKYFEEPQNLYINVKVYTYTPLLRYPKLDISGKTLNSSNSSSEKTGGWGETFNFSVEAGDRFDRSVTVYAWHKKGAENYKLISSQVCASCSLYRQINFTYDYNGSDIAATDGWTFMFNATNADGSNSQSGFTYTIEKDDINTTYVFPSNEVSINRNESTIFSVRSYDRDNSSYPTGTGEAIGKIYISVLAINNFESSPSTIAASTGFFNRTVTNAQWCADTSSYYLGKHGWYGGTEAGDYVKNNLTKDYIGYRNFTLVGSLINTPSLPTGLTNFTRGSTINFAGTVKDDCGTGTTASTTIKYNMSTVGYWAECTADATGACTIDTSVAFPIGWYNVTMSSNYTGYNNGTVLNQSLFFLGTISQLDNPGKAPTATTVAWGLSPLNFIVNVTDIDNNTVTAQLWIRNTTVDYRLENTTSCTGCNDYLFNTSRNFTYLNIAGNPWYFLFNSTDSEGLGVNTTTPITFNITTDDINFSSFGGNNSVINRSDLGATNTLNLSTYIYDIILNANSLIATTPNVSLSELTIYVYNGTAYLSNSTEEYQNGTTNYYKQFNPGCNYDAGLQNWYAEANGSSAYSNNITAIGSLKVQIYGDINDSYNSPTGQASYERGVSINLVSSLTDDCGNNVTNGNVIYNITSNATSYPCGPATNATGHVYTCSFDTTGKNVGIYNVTTKGYKDYYNNGTDFEQSAFEIKSTPALTGANVNINSDGWGVARNFSVNVTDNTGDTVMVYLWQDLGSGWELVDNKSCTSCSNTPVSFLTNYLCSEKGAGKSFKFNATDTEGNTYETSSGSFTIETDNVVVYYSSGNETVVNVLNSSQFVIRVYDSDNQTYNLYEIATVGFNVSKSGRGTTASFVAANTTNASGYATYYFTPDSTYTVGKQDWLGYVGTQTCYSYNTSSNFNVTTLTNAPQLVNVTVNPRNDGWGIRKDFNITVRDMNNTATARLWRASSATSPTWIEMNSTTYDSVGNWQILNFTQTFDYSLKGTWYFMFNSTNAIGNKYDTGEATVNTTNNFTLEAENVLLYYLGGHDSISNRSQNQTTRLSFRVQDENGTYLADFPMKFSVQSDGTNYFTDNYFVVNTNSTGYANLDFNATCLGSVAGAPKFLVGTQLWKVAVNDSKLTDYQQNDSSSFLPRNTSVRGDIILTFTTPDGSTNYTQEGTITYLGATTDDCGDALVTTVIYNTTSTANAFQCTNNTQIGANAFQCNYLTTLATRLGWYNVTMIANKTNHYNNLSLKTGYPGYFYILPKKKLQNPTGVPSSAGWGYPNWNFSVLSSSGDIDNVLQTNLFMARSVNPTTQCTGPTCVNQTQIICDNCSNQFVTYYRNFTDSNPALNTIGTWYYQFKLNDTALTSTSGTDYSVIVTKDSNNITYGGQGNGEEVVINTSAKTLAVRVFDKDKNSYNVTNPSANVTFKLLNEGYSGSQKIIGYNATNSTGYAIFLFNATTCNYVSGSQVWVGEIESAEPNYQANISGNQTLTMTLTGCTANIAVDQVLTPKDIFQKINFTVNSTINSFGGTSNNVNATLNVPSAWNVWPNRTQSLGTVTGPTPVSWIVNATTYGNLNATVFANSSNAGQDTGDDIVDFFQVYKEFPEIITLTTLPYVLISSEEKIFSWNCNVGYYRIANLDISINGTSKLKVSTYNGVLWKDIMHSLPINTSGAINNISIPVLSEQIFTNESGKCAVKLKNVGSSNINIISLNLSAYYSEGVKIQDIISKIGSTETTGLEAYGELFNVSIKLSNSLSSSKSVSLILNITNSSGNVVNSSTNSSIVVPASSNVYVNFTNINTSTWTEGNYNLNAYLTGDEINNRTELIILRNVSIYGTLYDYMCNGTTEEYNVTVYHPFNDVIDYNMSLVVPSGWVYSGYQWINATSPGNYSVLFNITSNQTNSNPTIVAFVNYTYPGLAKGKSVGQNVKNNQSIPILEVIRETPKEVGNYTELSSRLIIYNKGCGTASSISLTETTSAGWTAYGQTLDGVSIGTTDIPNRKISFSSSDFGTIDAKEYKVIEYKLLSNPNLYDEGTLTYNLTWGNRNIYETGGSKINTTRYSPEPHLVFEINAVGSYKEKSAEPHKFQLFNLSTINRGAGNATNWNITLNIPSDCNVTNVSDSGIYNSTNKTIKWQLSNLESGSEKIYNFSMNCTTQEKKLLTATATNDTRDQITVINNSVNLGCSGSDCEISQNYTFPLPPEGLRYEHHNEIDFYVYYNWTAYGLTIGEGHVGLHDDDGEERIIWQNYSLTNSGGEIWSNYTFDESEVVHFSNPEHKNELHVRSFSDGTQGATGNVTVEQIANSWHHGRLFQDTQNLFVNIKSYTFVPEAPTLTSPDNASNQFSTPVVLAWESQTPPAGVTLTYYVYGDNINGNTLLGTTSDIFYLWRNIDSGTYYWKVKATTSEGQNSSMSETRQFALDMCTSDTDYAYALNYPMSYNLTTDTITVWGSNGTGYTAMGNNESNPITFEKIYQYGRAARGACAVSKPSTGSYTLLSRLEFGNISNNINTTFVRTIGESISFNKQVQLNFNSTLISGNLTSGGSPFAGSTLSFGGLDATDSNEGELYLRSGSELRLYNTGVSHAISANNSAPFRLYWNGNVKAKASTLQNWYTIRFLGSNNSLEDIILTNMGEGFYPATTQIGNLNVIKSRSIDTGGLVLEGNSNATVTALEISESEDDILIINYNGTTNLVNPTLNFSNLNWTTGTFTGSINRKYDYTPAIIDSAGSIIENANLNLKDIRGDVIFNLLTDTSGTIAKQTVTRSIYDYNFKTGDERGPHTFKVKKFGKNFQTLAKQFSALTVETLQMSDNPFVELTEAGVLNLTGITFSPPKIINYGDEIWSNFTTSGNLNKTPVTQSEFFSIFGYDGVNENRKLTLVADTPNANGEYSINYQTGVLTFYNNQLGHAVTPVYSYSGNITISTGTTQANCISMSDLYSYMQYNLSEVLQTVDGVAYTSYVNLIIGNSTTGGCIVDSAASLTFEDGYTYSFSTIGGYIDLYGVTAGSGSGGGLPLNIFDDTGSTYSPNDLVYVFSTILDSTGALVSAIVNVTTYYPNLTVLDSGLSTETSTGRFRRNFTLPAAAPEGTYSVEIDATYQTDEVHDTLIFQVSSTSGGSAYPTIELQAATPIATATTTSIGALVKNSAGIISNCNDNLSLTITNLLNGSIVQNGNMTNFGTGLYNYSWTTPVETSIFYVNASCTISGNSYTGFTLISTQSIGAPAPSIDYNQIAQYVWAYTSRNLTYYNQSVSENIQSCLRDGQCSNWWINTTFININNTLNIINASVLNINDNTQNIGAYFNCTESNEVCTKLQNINLSATDIQSRIISLNSTQIPNLQTSVNNIYADTQWLYSNVATQTNITEVIAGINNLQTNISYIKNNMFYQGNATGAFIVNYLSTVYGEPGRNMDLWILTSDLLGNEKTVSAAQCEIRKSGQLISGTTTEINLGTVHSNWTVNSSIEQGSYYWNCTLTGSTLSLEVPFYLGGSFEITSLSAVSPKYPNENAVIEATFASANGTSIEPDTINLTIWKPNYLTVWKSAVKSGFSQQGDIWYYADMIEATPTTGTYYVHMNASKNGISSSRTTQFRIATGGPYSITLNCPSSSPVGSNLDCNLIILDEGEAATESICDVWVDTDGDSVLDGTEPQSQYSQETVPLQNLTRAVSINVPSTHTTGLYVIRTSCRYVNSAQPNSTASDSVIFTAAGAVAPPIISGGGGGSSSTTTHFDVDFTTKSIVTFNAVQGSSKTFTFDRITSHKIKIESVNRSTVTFVLSLDLIRIAMGVGETKEIDINRDGLNDIRINLNKINKGIVEYSIEKLEVGVATITGKTIIHPEHMTDVFTKILDEYKIINPGSKILMEVTIYNLGTEEIKDAKVRYCIETYNRGTIKCNEETVAVYTKLQIIKEFLISSDTTPGEYFIKTEVSYNDQTATSETSFEVKASGFAVQKDFIINYLLPLGLGILILMMLIILILIYKKKRKTRRLKKAPRYPKSKPLRSIKSKKNVKTSMKIFSILQRFIERKFKKYPKDSVTGLMNKQVYSVGGRYIGKVKEVILKDKGIESLRIKFDKKYKFKTKGIIVNYKQIRSINEIVIISRNVLNGIN